MAAEAPLVLPTVSDDLSLPSLSMSGVKLHLTTQGDPQNDTVVLVHGGPGNDHRHLLALSPLSQEYHLVFYDQRGAGLSERVSDEQVDLLQLTDELDAIGQHFSPGKKLRLIGHSWGAMLAAAYLERHPDRVSHLVLVEPGFLNQETFDRFLAGTNGGLPQFSLALLGRLWTSGLRSLKINGPDKDAALDNFVLELAMSDVPGHPMSGYFCGGKPTPGTFDAWRMGARSSIAIQTKGIDDSRRLRGSFVGENTLAFPHRVLFLTGSCNTLIGAEQQKLHMRLYSNPDLVVIQNAGHMMLQEKTAESLSSIRSYLARPHETPQDL